MSKLRSPLKWHGGKSYLAKRIIDLMPAHAVYVEPYIGGGSVLLNKPPSMVEFAGDIHPQLINFWGVLAGVDTYLELESILRRQPYARDSFEAAVAITRYGHSNSCVRAGAYMVRNRMSRGGLGKVFAWSDRMRGGRPGDVNAWETILAELPVVHSRIKCVGFENCTGIKLMAKVKKYWGVFAYLDPPYLPETRTAKAYQHEMSQEDHEELMECILDHPAKIMISGYRSPLYDVALREWNRVDIQMPNHAGQGKTKQRRVESLWMNF